MSSALSSSSEETICDNSVSLVVMKFDTSGGNTGTAGAAAFRVSNRIQVLHSGNKRAFICPARFQYSTVFVNSQCRSVFSCFHKIVIVPTGKTPAVSLKADSTFQLVRAGCEGADIVFACFGTGLAAEAFRPLAAHTEAFYLSYMKKIIDIHERSRLPWQFFGAAKLVFERL